MTTKTRVVLVDDHHLVRESLQLYLESFDDIEIIGVVDAAETLFEQIEAWLPQVVVMDLLLPGGMDGIEATTLLKKRVPQTQVVILTAAADDARVVAGLRAGAISYVRKNAHLSVLLDAVRGAARGQSILEPQIAAVLLSDLANEKEEALSEREREVLRLLASGKTNKEIGEELHISGETVKSHVGNILAKFQLAHRTQAIVYALKKGILSLDEVDIS